MSSRCLPDASRHCSVRQQGIGSVQHQNDVLFFNKNNVLVRTGKIVFLNKSNVLFLTGTTYCVCNKNNSFGYTYTPVRYVVIWGWKLSQLMFCVAVVRCIHHISRSWTSHVVPRKTEPCTSPCIRSAHTSPYTIPLYVGGTRLAWSNLHDESLRKLRMKVSGWTAHNSWLKSCDESLRVNV